MTISGTSLRGGTSKQSFMLFLFSICHHHQERLLHSITHPPSSVRNDDLWYAVYFLSPSRKDCFTPSHIPLSSVRNDEYISISPKAITHQQPVYYRFRLNVPYQRLTRLFLYLPDYFLLRIP
jgi:hypothetical protein